MYPLVTNQRYGIATRSDAQNRQSANLIMHLQGAQPARQRMHTATPAVVFTVTLPQSMELHCQFVLLTVYTNIDTAAEDAPPIAANTSALQSFRTAAFSASSNLKSHQNCASCT